MVTVRAASVVTIVMERPESKTISAACGSNHGLNTLTGVLPSPCTAFAPPSQIIRYKLILSGHCCTALAILVNGPSAKRVIPASALVHKKPAASCGRLETSCGNYIPINHNRNFCPPRGLEQQQGVARRILHRGIACNSSNAKYLNLGRVLQQVGNGGRIIHTNISINDHPYCRPRGRASASQRGGPQKAEGQNSYKKEQE